VLNPSLELDSKASRLDQAIEALDAGQPIMIFDNADREGETDFFFSGTTVLPENIQFLRKNGGGLIFIAVNFESANDFGLPFLEHSFTVSSEKYPILSNLMKHKIPYDTHSSFSISINHNDTYTGITDNDRALTVSQFSNLVSNSSSDKISDSFSSNFRTPGHVPICIANENYINGREGHTELIVSLMKLGNLSPVAVGCEILSDTGSALGPEEAQKLAKDWGYVFLEGEEIKDAWQRSEF
tara:strand:+ start:437 stop:1159 length:723 start_codon:yes stop_codon:yes gene_type:complete